MPQRKPPNNDPSRLTDEECDYIIKRVLFTLSAATQPIAFFLELGRPVVFEVRDENREQVRNLIRLFAGIDVKT